MNNEKGSIAKITAASIGIILLFVVGLPLLGAALGIINLPFLKLGAKVHLNQGVITKTYNTDYCLNNYEWFKDTYNSIQQSYTQIQNLQDQLASFEQVNGTDGNKWGYSQQQQYAQITGEITGAKNYQADLIGQYNSKTSQLNRVACKELPLFVKP